MPTQKSFEKYFETEFTFCGTSELEKSMHVVRILKLEMGSVLIKGGLPHHAMPVQGYGRRK